MEFCKLTRRRASVVSHSWSYTCENHVKHQGGRPREKYRDRAHHSVGRQVPLENNPSQTVSSLAGCQSKFLCTPRGAGPRNGLRDCHSFPTAHSLGQGHAPVITSFVPGAEAAEMSPLPRGCPRPAVMCPSLPSRLMPCSPPLLSLPAALVWYGVHFLLFLLPVSLRTAAKTTSRGLF